MEMSQNDIDEEPCRVTQYWGEYLDNSDEDDDKNDETVLPNVSEDIQRSMQDDCLSMYKDDDNTMQIQDITLDPIDPLVMYAIQLRKWMNNMVETMRVAEVAVESDLIIPENAKIPIPEMPNINLKHKKNQLNFIPYRPLPKDKEEVNIPEISEPIVKLILEKCVAALTAQIGFEDSYQSVLDVLVDVLEQFFVKICGRFVFALQEEEQLDTGDFQNVLERVLVEAGFGGAKGLHNYYQSRIIKYISLLQKRCQDLERQYSALKMSKPKSPTRDFGRWYGVTVKKEADSMDADSEMGNNEAELITTSSDLLQSLESQPMAGHQSTTLSEHDVTMLFSN